MFYNFYKKRFFLLIIIFLFSIILTNIFLIERFEFNIYDKDKPIYNIGDLMDMPYYWYPDWCKEYDTPEKVDEYHASILEKSKQYPNSILYNYYMSNPFDNHEIRPNVEKIRSAVDKYIQDNHDTLSQIKNTIEDDKTLTIHVRSGDKGVIEEEYKKNIKDISKEYDNVIILSGIHSDGNIEDSKKNLDESLKSIDIKDKNVIFHLDEPDIHLSIMRMSSNLLLHKGGFSILGGLLFQKNKLYISPFFDNKKNEEYMNYLQGKKILL
jgi:hypothetical protein